MFKRNLFAMLLVLVLLMPMSVVCAENADPITIHIYGIGATLPEDDPVIPELKSAWELTLSLTRRQAAPRTRPA